VRGVTDTSIASRLAAVRDRIGRAAERAGRDPSRVRLVAVSKGHPADAIRRAYELGQRDFGENYVQELVGKASALADLVELRWHVIGSLQRNKARDVARLAHAIHTVDRKELALELDRRAEGRAEPLPVLLEVNVAAEPQKAGVLPEHLGELLDATRACSRLRVVGLMTIPPDVEDPEEVRPCFARLRELRDRLLGAEAELSMGMSHDVEIAVEEGATLVRVGTAIFGPRAPKPPR
jgi:pyridoxal phosphate enzyme (YggS family)